MKTNPDYVLAVLGDSFLLVPVGAAAKEFKGVISLNEMGKRIWELLTEKHDTDAVVAAILAEYDVSEEQVRSDVNRFLSALREKGCIED